MVVAVEPGVVHVQIAQHVSYHEDDDRRRADPDQDDRGRTHLPTLAPARRWDAAVIDLIRSRHANADGYTCRVFTVDGEVVPPLAVHDDLRPFT